MAKGRKENLIPLNKRTKEAQREIAKKGAEASNKKQAQRRALKEELKTLLEVMGEKGENAQNKMCLALLKQAQKGNVKAFEVIRDTIGEKPIDVHQIVTPKEIEAAQDKIKEALFDAKRNTGAAT